MSGDTCIKVHAICPRCLRFFMKDITEADAAVLSIDPNRAIPTDELFMTLCDQEKPLTTNTL